MKICPKCNEEFQDEYSFCNSCGLGLESVEENYFDEEVSDDEVSDDDTPNDNIPEKKSHTALTAMIALLSVLLIAGGAFLIFMELGVMSQFSHLKTRMKTDEAYLSSLDEHLVPVHLFFAYMDEKNPNYFDVIKLYAPDGILSIETSLHTALMSQNNISEDYKSFFTFNYNKLVQKYGDDYSVSYNVLSSEEISGEDYSNQESYIHSYEAAILKTYNYIVKSEESLFANKYNIDLEQFFEYQTFKSAVMNYTSDINIESIYIVTVEYTISGKADSVTKEMQIPVYKSNGCWYICTGQDTTEQLLSLTDLDSYINENL